MRKLLIKAIIDVTVKGLSPMTVESVENTLKAMADNDLIVYAQNVGVDTDAIFASLAA